MTVPKELIFVYNAKSGKINAIKDYFHKVISPTTYDCKLCSLTYNLLGMRSEWKTAIEKTGLKTVFLHKDELEKEYNLSYVLPVIIMKDGEDIRILLSADEINKTENLNALIKKINKAV